MEVLALDAFMPFTMMTWELSSYKYEEPATSTLERLGFETRVLNLNGHCIYSRVHLYGVNTKP